MQTKIVLRHIARLTEDGLGLDLACRLDADNGADRAPVGLGAFKPKVESSGRMLETPEDHSAEATESLPYS